MVHSPVALEEPGDSGQEKNGKRHGAEAQVRQTEEFSGERGDCRGEIARPAETGAGCFDGDQCQDRDDACGQGGLCGDGGAVAASVPHVFLHQFSQPGIGRPRAFDGSEGELIHDGVRKG